MAEEYSSPSRVPPDVLRDRLTSIVTGRPECTNDEDGQPSIPARIIPSVLDDYAKEYGMAALPPQQHEQLAAFSSMTSDGHIIALNDLLKLIAGFIAHSPRRPSEAQYESAEHVASLDESLARGREEERDHRGSQSRSSSNDSVVTSYYRPDGGRRSRAPSIPTTPGPSQAVDVPYTPSPFDAQMRQRAVPLTNVPPSSFNKRPQAPYRRRKSDGGPSPHVSDNEGSGPSFRRRAPSNPVTLDSPEAFKPIPVPESPRSAPSSTPDNSFTFPRRPIRPSPPNPQSPQSGHSFEEDELVGNDSALSVDEMLGIEGQMETFVSDPGDDEADTVSLSDMLMRNVVDSTASSGPEERLAALQKVNTDLSKRLRESERTLGARLQEREVEIEELSVRLQQMKDEVESAKNDERAARNKERASAKRLAEMESEIAKLERSLQTSRSTHQTMVKQYQEQLTEAERYRAQLRKADLQVRDAELLVIQSSKEADKAVGEKAILENQMVTMQEELDITRAAQRELEEQKQENLLLKETIDRLRFDMDQLRNEATNNVKSGINSQPGTMSRSLANEIKAKLDTQQEDEEHTVESAVLADMSMESSTTVEDRSVDLDEDYVETIITTSRRRKVPPRQGSVNVSRFEETKEYADAEAQHDISEFVRSVITQTLPPPAPPAKFAMDIQTEPEPAPPVRATTSVEVQTELLPEPEPVAGPSTLRLVKQEEEDLSSSVETVRGTSPVSSIPLDSPPSYGDIAEHERYKLMQKWHPGLHGNTSSGIKGGISSNVLREWANVKRELGFDCVAIDRTLQASDVNGERAKEEEDDLEEEIVGAGRRGSRKFYNIYNTFVLGQGTGSNSGDPSPSRAVSWRDLALVGAGAGVVLAAVGLPAWNQTAMTHANTVIGSHVDGAHGLGDSPTYDAFWVVVERIIWHGVNAARRVPPFPPT